MPAVLCELADAVVARLNDADLEWSQEFSATRLPIDFADELDDDGLHVDAAFRSGAGAMETRGDQQDTYEIDVAVRKKCNVSDPAVTDPLWLLVQEIRDNFLGQRLPDYEAAVCTEWKSTPLYYRKAAVEMHQFAAAVTFTFVVSRGL